MTKTAHGIIIGKENLLRECIDIDKPKMLLFDFGGTLFDDGPFDLFSGLDALRKAAENPSDVSTQELCSLWNNLSAQFRGVKSRSGCGVDILVSTQIRNITVRSGLRYNIPLLEQELIFDRFNSAREQTPHIAGLLAACGELGIRTAVISNNEMSSEGLAVSVDEGLPGNRMEFCISSADYILCKPAPDMFEAAVKTAGLCPADCWYCGNDLHCDVYGSLAAGMFPVFYDRKSESPSKTEKTPEGKEYLVVNDWSELSRLLGTY